MSWNSLRKSNHGTYITIGINNNPVTNRRIVYGRSTFFARISINDAITKKVRTAKTNSIFFIDK